ncbi:Protein translocase subunit SecA like [Actinidia chinensis var. chinensis]|uniref:Protein translocase subunit SecA like n=1 Tax=Actinidia chinensis var. chinensis TaxID=1590841 RepID=A0A2R6PZR8_ACTCC|nr:Protein translocase subunit SecA like [Actinidia chinensis var. chinensis]
MDYHSIQSEKAKAMMRFRRLRNIAKMWRLLELLVAIAVLSWSSTRRPLALKLAGQFVLQLYEYIFHPFFNFVIGNAIIIVVVLISRKNNAGDNEISDPYVENGDALNHAVSDELTQIPEASPVEEKECENKQIVISENAVTESQCDAVSTAIEEATKQIQRFQRTQSEKLKSDLRVKPRRELRRSETVAISDNRAISSLDTVDTLSSEEFRRKIETFIAEQQRFLWSQRMAEDNY